MATFIPFNSLAATPYNKTHNFSSDTIKVALTNVAPSTSNTVLANITEISYTNCSSRTVTVTSSSQSSGVYKLIIADLSLTASGGTVGAFRYLVLYNDTATNDELICYADLGSAITLNDGDQLNIDFDGTNGVLKTTFV